MGAPLTHLGPPILLLLQLLPLPTFAFFPNIWSLLAAPGSVTHQDLTEEAALNVTLQLFLDRPSPGRPRLRLEDYRVSEHSWALSPLSSYSSQRFLRWRALVVRAGSVSIPPAHFHAPPSATPPPENSLYPAVTPVTPALENCCLRPAWISYIVSATPPGLHRKLQSPNGAPCPHSVHTQPRVPVAMVIGAVAEAKGLLWSPRPSPLLLGPDPPC